MSEEVKIYTTPTCPHCRTAKEYLSKKGIKFIAYDVTQDKDALKEMIDISGARSVPVVSACGEVMVGFDPQKIDQMLNCIENRSDV
ncbi:MAG: Uxx-star family glutaredoxin-like (seleno)protein [Spirochaetota bacterium]|nr:Uxx-star family glutaredoxin-like (seleno)protein [Spirochaetota bacterium]